MNKSQHEAESRRFFFLVSAGDVMKIAGLVVFFIGVATLLFDTMTPFYCLAGVGIGLIVLSIFITPKADGEFHGMDEE